MLGVGGLRRQEAHGGAGCEMRDGGFGCVLDLGVRKGGEVRVETGLVFAWGFVGAARRRRQAGEDRRRGLCTARQGETRRGEGKARRGKAREGKRCHRENGDVNRTGTVRYEYMKFCPSQQREDKGGRGGKGCIYNDYI